MLRRLGMQVVPVDDEYCSGNGRSAARPCAGTTCAADAGQFLRARAAAGPARQAIVPLPGGCNIGNRPVDLHLKGLAALGADIRLEHGYVVASARRLTGATIDLSGPSGPTVTGTANVMSAAVLARGVNRSFVSAAIEPEIVDLGHFLVALGRHGSKGWARRRIRIEGVDQLGGATHRLFPTASRPPRC